MRTAIDIDDAPMAEVMEAGGVKTKKAAVGDARHGKLDRDGLLADIRRHR